MSKIKMVTPVVEMDGDEMARVIWGVIKETLITPYIDLLAEYYDLSLLNRDKTRDQVTIDSANAAKKYGVAVKCATITPNRRQMEEFKLAELWPSANAIVRSMLDGTVFRTPIVIDSIKPTVRTWEKPITVARHAYGDVYKSAEIFADEPGECVMTFTGASGATRTISVQATNGSAIFLAQHNTESSIRSFARSCFQYAADTRQDLWFSAKDTISKTYDGYFKDVFDEEYDSYKDRFNEIGIKYFYTLIDDAVARTVRSKGGYIWACKNYDGDVMSDMISSAFGSLAMMTSVLVSPDGNYEFEAAHGTVARHYYRYLKGEKTSTNPIAMIFAWAGALKKRGELDGLPELQGFANSLERACFDTLRAGVMTSDIAALAEPGFVEKIADSWEFIGAIQEQLLVILHESE